MVINTEDIGVFNSTMSIKQADSWLLGDDDNLSIEANGAIDEATSHARSHGVAYVIIKIGDLP